MTTWLTVFYTVSVFVLLALASGLLYSRLERNMRQQDEDFLSHKMQVLAALLQKAPLDRAGVNQEVLEEAEISGSSPSPFFLRVLDAAGRPLDETPGMAAIIPAAAFPAGTSRDPRRWSARGGSQFLLAARSVHATGATWRVQAAVNVSAQESLLAEYRRDIAVVLVGGLLVAGLLGAWITRRGLRPIAAITRATERIGAQHLEERIHSGPWPAELAALASAFDHMLDRLQEAFERLSQFSADLAHELRTPINNLVGEAQVALALPRSSAEYTRVLQSALEEYQRLARMIDSMLFLAQADQARAALTLTRLDARAELKAVADFYQPLADEQGVTLVCEGEATVLADALLLRRALSNLTSNALRYTREGGRVTLRAETSPQGGATLSVRDSGIGIAARHLPKLGDRFYRVEAAREGGAHGAGLGLAIVKSIIALHGGTLVIESTPGEGTLARLNFTSPATLAHATA